MGAWFSGPYHFAHDAWQELTGHPFRDDPFTEADWQAHITWRRYIPEPSVSGIVIISLAPIWGWSVFVSALVGLYATYAEPAGWPNLTGHSSLLTLFTLTSFALSLLMLFKTTTSYSRWWEARTLWGSGYITVRSVLRLCLSFVGRSRPQLVPALYRWTAAVLPALAAHLRGKEHYFDDHLTSVLHPAELQWLKARAGQGIPPIAALQVLSRLLDRAGLHAMERQQVEGLLSQLDVVIGGCERIRAQPIPYAWNRHTHRFILCYITFLPFALWSLYHWATLPIMAIFSFLLAGVENVGVQIEEPNRVLPLNHICSGTCRALRLMVQDRRPSADMASFAAGVASTHFSPDLAVDLAPPIQRAEAKERLEVRPGAAPGASSDSGDSWGYASDADVQPRRSRRGGSRGDGHRATASQEATIELALPGGATQRRPPSATAVGTPAIHDATGQSQP